MNNNDFLTWKISQTNKILVRQMCRLSEVNQVECIPCSGFVVRRLICFPIIILSSLSPGRQETYLPSFPWAVASECDSTSASGDAAYHDQDLCLNDPGSEMKQSQG